MMNADNYWTPFEETIDSYEELFERLNTVLVKWASKNRVFAWRGQVQADWPLHSSLYRRQNWTSKASSPPEEADIYKAETDILADLHRWGLHVSPTVGRISILNQLATLQHYGAPTRLIDVTFNPWIAAWFATEMKQENSLKPYEEMDARLFAVDVTQNTISERDELRDWEDDLHRPWPQPARKGDSDKNRNISHRWTSEVYAWKPPRFDGRMAAQNGGFIFGGVPSTSGADGKKTNSYPKLAKGNWKINEVRSSTSLALRPHKLNTIKGGVSNGAVYSFRISAKAKSEIRERLEKGYSYKHATIYPDYTGFAQHACSHLRTRPEPPKESS
jgi:hypothetical protein